MNYCIEVKTSKNRSIQFDEIALHNNRYEKDGISLSIEGVQDAWKVGVKTDHPDERILSIQHRITLGLRNYNHVIVPDCGRFFCAENQLVDFWAFEKDSQINHIRVPLFIFTNQQNNVGLSFGIIGKPYETRFKCLEPFQSRALSAYTKKLTLEISRGFDDNHIPKEYMDNNENYFEEYVYIKNYQDGSDLTWIDELRHFSQIEKDVFNITLPYDEGSLEPLWCSWTDWFSDHVTEEVIIEQVRAGVPLGIKNYIIDDGWFGPGLDNDYEVELNIGDWEPDPSKISDLTELSGKIRQFGGRPLIWCAPHAVGRKAKCHSERLPYLCTDKDGKLINTSNDFNILCVRNPEAREIMADICFRLAVAYDTDGAKYDLFNCIPNVTCCSKDHEHDTDSMIVGLERLMALIWKRLKEVKPNYIVELKQNYGGVHLAQYGSMMRAGDTPYSPEGNFLRTAYVQGYSQYAINDYQTITDRDNIESSAIMVIKMMAVGIPTYSMDIAKLHLEHKMMLKNYHEWYNAHIDIMKKFRQPLFEKLQAWKLEGEEKDIYFILDEVPAVSINARNFDLLNGSGANSVIVESNGQYKISYYNCFGEIIQESTEEFDGLGTLSIPSGCRVSGELTKM